MHVAIRRVFDNPSQGSHFETRSDRASVCNQLTELLLSNWLQLIKPTCKSSHSPCKWLKQRVHLKSKTTEGTKQEFRVINLALLAVYALCKNRKLDSNCD